MPSSEQTRESKQKAEEWANSFVVGEEVEIRAISKYSPWEPGRIIGKWTSQTWPVLLLLASHGGFSPFGYADRERIRKLHETA